ncbi:MAG: hypothetical protein QOF44_2583 [Streptomyces sp.]|nr:hypothetical protein [Streptomyces sp.]
MSLDGTRAHATASDALPPLVTDAVQAAERLGFDYSCRPEHGRLLQALAAGATRIGETGTGCGVGLAWLASGMRPGAVAVSVERDPVRAEAAATVFAGRDDVTVTCGDWTAISAHAPYDLLVLDGGGQGKGDGLPADPERLLRPGGVLVVDDFTPSHTWPPLHDGRPDEARLHWLTHPALRSVELPLAPDLAVLVGTRRIPSPTETWTVGAVILNPAGKAFAQKRSPDRRLFPDCWDIVGGHVDPGETLLEALLREVEEETGWRVRRIVRSLGTSTWTGDDGLGLRHEADYVIEVDSDLANPRLEWAKHSTYDWFGPADLPRLLENRTPAEFLVHDLIASALGQG